MAEHNEIESEEIVLLVSVYFSSLAKNEIHLILVSKNLRVRYNFLANFLDLEYSMLVCNHTLCKVLQY